jgi:hypothetical protein
MGPPIGALTSYRRRGAKLPGTEFHIRTPRDGDATERGDLGRLKNLEHIKSDIQCG